MSKGDSSNVLANIQLHNKLSNKLLLDAYRRYLEKGVRGSQTRDARFFDLNCLMIFGPRYVIQVEAFWPAPVRRYFKL